MSANPYTPYSSNIPENAKTARTVPPFLRAMTVLIIFNTCLAASLSYFWTPASELKAPGFLLIRLLAIFAYCLMFAGAYLLHRRSRYAYLPILIHTIYALIIYAINFTSLRDIAAWLLQYSYLLGSNARIDRYAEYLLLVSYGFAMCLFYLSYCIYWRKKGLLT